VGVSPNRIETMESMLAINLCEICVFSVSYKHQCQILLFISVNMILGANVEGYKPQCIGAFTALVGSFPMCDTSSPLMMTIARSSHGPWPTCMDIILRMGRRPNGSIVPKPEHSMAHHILYARAPTTGQRGSRNKAKPTLKTSPSVVPRGLQMSALFSITTSTNNK
jgi:hypothetical protein